MNVVPGCFAEKTPVFASDVFGTSATEAIKFGQSEMQSSGIAHFLTGFFKPSREHLPNGFTLMLITDIREEFA